MIFSTTKIARKGSVVKAVADWRATINTKGKIVADTFCNLTVNDGLQAVDSFVVDKQNVYQYLPSVGQKSCYLSPQGLVVDGVVVADEFANVDYASYAFDGYTNTLVVTSLNTPTYKVDELSAEKICSEGFCDVVFFKGRLCALSGNKIYYSQVGDYADIDNLNYVVLPSSAQKLVVAEDLFAVGNDVYKVQFDGDESFSKITRICANLGDILPKTVAKYGNCMLFVADGKLLSLQNGNVKTLAEKVSDVRCGGVFAGLYYLAYSKKGVGYVDALNVANGKKVACYQIDCSTFFSLNGLYVTGKNVGYKLTFGTTATTWKSKVINFDDKDSTKYLHRLVVDTLYPLDVHVIADTHRIYHVSGKDTPQSILIGGFGKNIQIELHAKGKVDVKTLSLTARSGVKV